ncbi:RusA family crossover junction endodeoxyribonuclease [Streptomyces sp. N2-109]|uniref:RusA family crossover junction endodeoxyribonuclease n=1 Tax=Streptomyces gossypii TaxID=2883101 RepID=A0ABT2JUY3_9ACTN|nr:RusA family crossover junction endodeoxyribonuclease [Streptomyces gossypii]MCT2591099.1 RusA family crossover junction endodeoxyribonuclease [Streptomyces gossypii]
MTAQIAAPAVVAGAAPADLTVIVHGTPGPQGSKRHVGRGVMVESSKKVKPWRQDVKASALQAMDSGDGKWQPLDGPLAVAVTFTVRHRPTSKPSWWPAGVRWSKTLMWRPASMPDLSKLLRSTEDALTDAGAWLDDARVVEYRRLAKHYVGDDAADVLRSGPGAVIHIWRLGGGR